MASHPLHSWRTYLAEQDYEFLIEYVENVRTGVPNNSMIILCGGERTGKTTLLNDIYRYLGNDISGPLPMNLEFIYWETIRPLGFLHDLEGIRNSRKTNRGIVNLIRYKQSFIGEIYYMNRIHPMLLPHSRVIHMDHVF
jgi:hypothetical protein